MDLRKRRNRKTRYLPARFDNRGKVDSIEPSIKSKVDSYLREKKFIGSILPISEWKVALASFDIHKISYPSVSNLHGWTSWYSTKEDFYNTMAYVLDSYTCPHYLKAKNARNYHIKFRSQSRADIPSHLITLCNDRHDNLLARKLGDQIDEKLTKKAAATSKTKHAKETETLESQLKKPG